MRRQILPALRMLVAMTLLTGVLYTASVTALAQTFFESRADGSLLVVDDEIVGSSLLGQTFTDPGYFHPRPSAVGYDPRLSGGSNFGPTNAEYRSTVAERARSYRETFGLDSSAAVPVDAVTTSASGLDPHISVENARLQAGRIAGARNVAATDVLDLIDSLSNAGSVGYLAHPSINVLLLNVALDDLYPAP